MLLSNNSLGDKLQLSGNSCHEKLWTSVDIVETKGWVHSIGHLFCQQMYCTTASVLSFWHQMYCSFASVVESTDVVQPLLQLYCEAGPVLWWLYCKDCRDVVVHLVLPMAGISCYFCGSSCYQHYHYLSVAVSSAASPRSHKQHKHYKIGWLETVQTLEILQRLETL